jgi:hypothetical protein
MASSDTRLADLLREADDAWLADLLAQRPDLARPVPRSLAALAGRAGSRASAARALATLDAALLVVLESAVVLASSSGTTSVSGLSVAVGHDAGAAVARLRSLALLLGEDDSLVPAAGVAEAIGPTPLGLGPSLRSLGVPLDAGWPTTGPALRTVLAEAPEGARRLLDALTWGPPVGTLGTEIPPAARWLLDHHVLHRSGTTEVVLPREVGVAARGRLARHVPQQAPLPDAAARRPGVVSAEVVAASDTILRQLHDLLEAWAQEPPPVLRAGGLAARDVKALATALGVDTGRAALVCELAGMVGLVGHSHHDDGNRWAPTIAAQTWQQQSPEDRWASVALAWLRSSRVPWLAGSRTEKGALRAALDPDLHRSWAAPLRSRCLSAVAAWPVDAAPSADQVRSRLAWLTPRSVPPLPTIAAVLGEAEAIGLLGAGALGAPARRLLDDGGQDAVAAALRDLYPTAVDELIVQGDLTAIVPGRPSERLAELLDACADVDSRGAALAVRFSAASIARAIEHWGAEELLERLRSASRAPLPQPLEYLVADAARRHRRVRVQAAAAVVRTDDEASAIALLGDPRLGHLGLRQIGTTTLAADASALAVHEALRGLGASPVLETADGRSLALPASRSQAARPALLEGPPVESAVAPDAAVAAMREGEARAEALLAGTAAHETPTDELDLLRAAAAHGADVTIVVAGAGGVAQERRVRPLSVDAGRVRLLDTAREAEITVATHRIVAVRP